MSYLTKAKKALIFNYLDTPEEERIPQKQFLKENHMIRVTLYKGEMIYAQEKAEEMKRNRESMFKKREAVNKLGNMIASSNEKWDSVEKAIYDKAVGGTVKAQELYAKLKGKLKEEVELKIGLSADEIARRNLIADRELQEEGRKGGHRVEEVQEEPSLLSE